MLLIFNGIVIPNDPLVRHRQIGMVHKVTVHHGYADTLSGGSYVGVKSNGKGKNGLCCEGADRFVVLHMSAKLGCCIEVTCIFAPLLSPLNVRCLC